MSAPIVGIVGGNGGGKTLCAVECYARPALERGRRVVATVEIDGAELLTSHREIPRLTDCVLLLDEITSAFPSRESGSMPAEIVRRLNQLRKVGVTVVWTAPAWERADKVLREVTNQVVVCRGMLPRYPWRSTCPPDCGTPTIVAFEGRYGSKPDVRCRAHRPLRDREDWPSNRLFRWRWYSAEMLQEFSLARIGVDRGKQRDRPVRSRWYWRPSDGQSGAQGLYRTLDEVVLLDHLDTYGTCFSCGGTRRRPKCGCDRSDPFVSLGSDLGPIAVGLSSPGEDEP